MRKLAILAPFALAACGSPEQPAGENTATIAPANEIAATPPGMLPPSNAATVTDSSFVGRWTGPEGLYADIAPAAAPGTFTVEMQYTLDDKGSFTGTRQGNVLTIERAGQTVILTPGNGDATGMKYLAGKTDCLIAIVGSEGYCRT